MWKKQRNIKLEHFGVGEKHLNSIINIFINTDDIAPTKQKEEHSENIKEPLEIKNTRAEIKTSIKEFLSVSKEAEWGERR